MEVLTYDIFRSSREITGQLKSKFGKLVQNVLWIYTCLCASDILYAAPLMSKPAASSEQSWVTHNLNTSADQNLCPCLCMSWGSLYTLSGTGVMGMANISMCNVKFTPRDVMPVILGASILASWTSWYLCRILLENSAVLG